MPLKYTWDRLVQELQQVLVTIAEFTYALLADPAAPSRPAGVVSPI